MALYYDAVTILTSEQGSGSLRSRIYGTNNLKSKPAQVYALISETARYDVFLKEVLDNTSLLKDEPKLTPLLALLLAHDHFFSKSGIAAPVKHPIRQAFEAHKARLQAEFTRARLRRRCPNVETLKKALLAEKGVLQKSHPRWARINALTVTDTSTVPSALGQSTRVDTLDGVLTFQGKGHCYCNDEHIPNLLAYSPEADLTSTNAYKSGQIILQDKASCFPAYLLLGNQNNSEIGDVIDGCAAPGNKTTHLAAIMKEQGLSGKIFACERDAKRSETLQSMVTRAGAEKQVDVLAKQDFLALDPNDPRFHNVTHLLLDPSCSGSGILGRADIPQLSLPNDPRAASKSTNTTQAASKSKKRKRETKDTKPPKTSDEPSQDPTLTNEEEIPIPDATQARLQKLSTLQSLIIEHAMSFPAATRLTYSTCSIHSQENEVVVSRVLASNVARQRGWQVLPRETQVDGMRRWRHRGVIGDEHLDLNGANVNGLGEEQLEGCVRCYPGDGERTMGFFVCGFVRGAEVGSGGERNGGGMGRLVREGEEEEWEGFDS